MANQKSIFRASDYTVIATVYNGGDSILLFLDQLEDCLGALPATFSVLIVDDASVDATASHLKNYQFSADNIEFQSLHLPFHSGRHEAIAQGLTVARQLNCRQFIVMEADGEDDPRAIAELIKIQDKDAVIVDRGPRAENLFFWIIFRLYQFIFRLFTSHELITGVYSMINRRTLVQLTQQSFFHYTASLYKLKLRGARLRLDRKGQKTSFQKDWKQLFAETVRSYMEFGEELLGAFIKLSLYFGFLLFAGSIALLYIYFFTEQSAPLWIMVATVGFLCATILSMGTFGIGVSVLQKVRSRSALTVSVTQEPAPAQSDNGPTPRKARIRLK